MRDLEGRDPDLGERAEPGVDTVDGGRRIAAGDHRIDDLARAVHRGQRARRDRHLAIAARDVGDRLESQDIVTQAERFHRGLCSSRVVARATPKSSE